MASTTIIRKLYHMCRKPYYPTNVMEEGQLNPLMNMTERQLVAGALVKRLGGVKILDIGSGHLPLYKYMKEGTYQTLTCVDPILATCEPRTGTKCLSLGIEQIEHEDKYDTIVLLGLSHMMGKNAFKTIDKILASSSTKNFILEHAVSSILPIYAKRITRELPKLTYKKRLSINFEYPKNLLGNKRHMEIWTR